MASAPPSATNSPAASPQVSPLPSPLHKKPRPSIDLQAIVLNEATRDSSARPRRVLPATPQEKGIGLTALKILQSESPKK